MSIKERDPHTGHMTTGHQWNGIKELNTKVPKPVWIFLSISVLVSLVMWLFLPAWPLGTTYTKGILGVDDRVELKEQLSDAAAKKQEINSQILNASYEEVKRDAALIGYVRTAGKFLFSDNCAACHGVDGGGGSGYPSLTDSAWLWADEDETIEDTIMETLRVGINDQHSDTRIAQMPSLGKDGTIDRKSIGVLTDYTLSLNEIPPKTPFDPDRVAAGKELFNENCSSCHGENAKGNQELGSPNLTDSHWIYGDSRQNIYDAIWNGRQGQMPSWESRLSEADRKLLTLYILDLGSARPKEQ